jgi:hypothetical protein
VLSLSRRAVVGGALLGAAAVTVPVALANANGTPADKAVAAASKVETIRNGGVVELMSATFRSSKPSDLLLSVSAECSILTDVVIPGGGTTFTEEARGTVKVWLEMDGHIVPITSSSTPPQDPAAQEPGDETDKVTFCDRLHRRTVTDREDDNTDYSRDWLETKSANAFNWVRLNAGSGLHTIVVKAEMTTNATGDSMAEAYVGNRTLIIEPTKMANDAVVG